MSAQYANAHDDGVQAAADELVIASVGVEALGGLRRVRGRADRAVVTPLEIQPAKPGAIARRRTVSLWIDGAWCDIEAHERSELQPGQTLRGPMLVSDPGATIWIARGWAARRPQRLAGARAGRRIDDGSTGPVHRVESSTARGVQRHLHARRRADGRGAAPDRELGQHQGTSRFLVRDLRRADRARRERAAHACAPGLDGRQRRRGRRAVWRRSSPRRCVPVELAVRGGHAPA